MLEREDKTYDQLREKSVDQWLDEISDHDDIVVRGGVRVTRDYIKDLQKKITNLENKDILKDKYLKKLRLKVNK